ncbi:MAG: hypothetical protein GXO17_01655 [Thermodesulfobacteria bacterium]|nr:hypothetical protein [Thermodesulfobacteriota bacterium]
MKKRVLLLFSEGLDSLLAGKLLAAQGLDVVAVRFITPFFGWSWKGREEEFAAKLREHGFEGFVKDITPEYLKMLANPAHGYGSGFNPCIDCKILMLKEAQKLLDEVGAEIIATGEVVGQRPMSQQRNTLRHIEKEAGLVGRVLRPLSAKKLPPTEYEKAGLVERERLLDVSGRGRKVQLKLAQEFGLKEIPSPAGGCLLTDPSLAPRIRRFFQLKDGRVSPREAELLVFGRHFELPTGAWLVIGRNEAENRRLLSLVGERDVILKLSQIPGPTGLLLLRDDEESLLEAGRLIKRYAPKARGLEKVPLRIIRLEAPEEVLFV